MPGPDPKVKAVSLGVVAYMNSRQQIIDLQLAQGGLCRLSKGRPENLSASYPCNPYIQCPRLWWVTETANFQGRACSGGNVFDTIITGSLFYWRRQVLGENHHEILINDLDSIATPFTRDKLMPAPISAPSIPGFFLEKCLPGVNTYHSDLHHRFNDPDLVVSVGQINFEIHGRFAQT